MSGITGGGSAVAAGSSSSSYHNLPAWVKEQTRGEPRSEPFPENFEFQTRFDTYLKKPLSEDLTVPRLQRELDSYGMFYKYSVKAGNDMILIQPDSYLRLNMFHATLHASGGRSFSSLGALHVKGEGAHRSKGIAIRFVPEFSEGKFSGVSLSNVVGDATLKPRMQTFANNVKEAITNVFKQIDEEMRTAAASSSRSGASSAVPGAVGGGSAQTGTAAASSSRSAASSAVPGAVGGGKPSLRPGALQHLPQQGPRKVSHFGATTARVVGTIGKTHKTQHRKRRHAVADAILSARTYRRSKSPNGAWIYTAENESGNVKEEETSLGLIDLQNTNGGWILKEHPRDKDKKYMYKSGQGRPVKSRRTRRSTRRTRRRRT